MGQGFYVAAVMIVSGILYIRIKNIAILGVLWMLVGSVFISTMPLVSPWAVLLTVFGIAAILYKLIMHTT
jgi:hypothetical protein